MRSGLCTLYTVSRHAHALTVCLKLTSHVTLSIRSGPAKTAFAEAFDLLRSEIVVKMSGLASGFLCFMSIRRTSDTASPQHEMSHEDSFCFYVKRTQTRPHSSSQNHGMAIVWLQFLPLCKYPVCLPVLAWVASQDSACMAVLLV